MRLRGLFKLNELKVPFGTPYRRLWFNATTDQIEIVGGGPESDHRKAIISNPSLYGISPQEFGQAGITDQNIHNYDGRVLFLAMKHHWVRLQVNPRNPDNSVAEGGSLGDLRKALEWMEGNYGGFKSLIISTRTGDGDQEGQAHRLSNPERIDYFIKSGKIPRPRFQENIGMEPSTEYYNTGKWSSKWSHAWISDRGRIMPDYEVSPKQARDLLGAGWMYVQPEQHSLTVHQIRPTVYASRAFRQLLRNYELTLGEGKVKTSIVVENDHDHDLALQQTGYWGRKGVGALLIAKDTSRIGLAHRSDAVQEPNTFGTVGGAIDVRENEIEALKRELNEELGYKFSPRDQIEKLDVFQDKSFRYTTYLVLIEHEFRPTHLNWENHDFIWINFGDWPSPLHPGLQHTLQKPAALSKIKAMTGPSR